MQPQRYGPFHYVPINRRPKITWPNGARVALWVIPNIETFPLNEPVPGGTGKTPDIINWAPRDYGNRVGIFRIMEVLARHSVRGTVALNSEVCDDYPQIVEDAVKLGWECMGHNQSNARYLHLMSPEEERRVVLDTFERIAQATGTRPKGWLSSGLQESWYTLDYLVEAGASYVADWVNDDHPYVMTVGGKRLCSIPYSTEINDLPQIIPRRPVVGRVRTDDAPPVRHALPRGCTVGTGHGDLSAPVRHRRAAPDRRARLGARVHPAPRGRVACDWGRDHRALSRIGRDILSRRAPGACQWAMRLRQALAHRTPARVRLFMRQHVAVRLTNDPWHPGSAQPSARPHHAPKTRASFWSSSASACETRLPNPRKPPAASATARARPRTLSRRLLRSVGESAAASADV